MENPYHSPQEPLDSGNRAAPSAVPDAPLPRTFWEYVRSFGPGLIVVLTWLGAGDIVDMGVAGGNYD